MSGEVGIVHPSVTPSAPRNCIAAGSALETEDKLLDFRLTETVKDFERVRTTNELIAGLRRQIRRLEEEA